MGVHFNPLWFLSLLSVGALAVLLQLGFWQLDRLQWKLDLIETVEARVNAEPVPLSRVLSRQTEDTNFDYYRVTVRGQFDHGSEFHRFYGTGADGPGYHVLTPFTTSDGQTLIVNRGFVPEGDCVHAPSGDFAFACLRGGLPPRRNRRRWHH